MFAVGCLPASSVNVILLHAVYAVNHDQCLALHEEFILLSNSSTVGCINYLVS